MTELQGKAQAKINLALDILGLREDGYHDLRMLMQSVSLADDVTLRLSEGGGRFSATSNLAHIPVDRRNLAVQAAKLYLSRTGRKTMSCAVHIHKRIPVCAGLGGGSSDAAAVLRMLHTHFGAEVSFETLMEWALEIGSDVPFCLQGGLCLATGRGEILTPLKPLPDCRFVLSVPSVSVSTAAAYRLADRRPIVYRPDWDGVETALNEGNLFGLASRLYNVFEEPISRKHRVIAEIHQILTEQGALGAVMSGSGSAVAGIFPDDASAEAAAGILSPLYENTFVASAV